MPPVAVRNQTHPLATPLNVGYASSFFSRLRGLMFTHPVNLSTGLVLDQKSESRLDAAIHMMFVNYDLGTVWLDKNCRVVDRCLARRWRLFYMPSKPARYILEIHPARMSEFSPGDQVVFDHATA